ncbi:hypothetical protein K2W90_00640 [Candidatus Babeliales bacterium]|nr:hypothetical protein [Candidatus Babeliales bacterium]
MMKSVVSAVLLTFSMCSHVSAKDSIMPSLRRVRDKVEEALRHPVQSFRDILKNSTVDEHGKQVITSGVVTASGIQPLQGADARLHVAMGKYRMVYWANNKDFFNRLKNSAAQSRAQALDLLEDCLTRKFAEERAPLISFAAQLKEEETILDQCVTELFALATYKNKDEQPSQAFYQQAQSCLQEAADLKTHLADLIGLVEKLLLEN